MEHGYWWDFILVDTSGIRQFAKLPHQSNHVYSIHTISQICTCMSTGQPVPWCLSDHECSDVIEAFLRSVQARSPLTIVNVMMTDDGMVEFYCLKH